MTELDSESVKSANEQILQSLGVVINTALPGIEGPNELQPRSAEEVAQRAVVLGYIIGIAFRQPGARLLAALQQYGLYEATTPEERGLLNSSEPTRQEQINCTWLTECVQALAWCMGLVGLDLQRRCDDDLGPRFPIFKEPQPFIATAKLRPFEEIYRMADLHYRAHWACRDAQLHHLASPLNEGVVKERRRALDWVIGVPYKWDEIPLDT